MIKKYFTFLSFLLLLCASNAFAQFCPPNGFSTGSSLYFYYESGTSLCGDRPATVTVDSSVFTLVHCTDDVSIYDLTSGSGVSNINLFSVDFGFDICEYQNGTLPTGKFTLKSKEVRIFPNPINSGNYLYADFGNYMSSADVAIYSVTGKQVLSFSMKNSNRAPLNIAGLSNGVYLLKIITNSETLTRKFVIMK